MQALCSMTTHMHSDKGGLIKKVNCMALSHYRLEH